MSVLAMVGMALAMICLAVSPMPIGHTSGLLLRAIRRQANRGALKEGSTMSVQRRQAVLARD